MTQAGLCIFLDISLTTWFNYKEKVDFLEVTTRAEQIIYEQKFTGASADLLNANIIARDLGLVDKKEAKIVGVIGLREVGTMTKEELEAELQEGGLIDKDSS